MSGLKRGLTILETLVRAKRAVSFTEINTALGIINRASLSQILKDLVAIGYVHKDDESGLYSCGHRMTVFLNMKEKSRTELLMTEYKNVMKEISQKFDVTVILFERVKNVLISILKEKTESSITMQDVGDVNEMSDNSPWAQVLRAYMQESPDKVSLRIRDHGYAYDNRAYFKHIRRLGFPLFDKENEVIGCLGIGGTILNITGKNLEQIVRFVRKQLKGVAMPRKS